MPVKRKKAKRKAPIEYLKMRGKAQDLEQYIHDDKKRVNNPPVGLVTPETDQDAPQKTYAYDPHIDPQLQWAGKTEHTSFQVDTVSLHVHERIDPISIIEQVEKKVPSEEFQTSLFNYHQFDAKNASPLREAIKFYEHEENWSNRLIAGDSLLVMNSLLQKENMAGKVQMIYIDPPYGIKYGSNFQPFVNKRDVKDGKDEDLTQEPETIKAFRDTWELGIHSYLTYLRDRLFMARELLHESGSIFVQISDENVHRVRQLLDEVFGAANFISEIVFRKKGMTLGAKTLETMNDFILWYCKDSKKVKYRQLFEEYNVEGASRWTMVELPNGVRRKLSPVEYENHSLLPKSSKVFRLVSQRAPSFSPNNVYNFTFNNVKYKAPGCWVTNKEGMEKLAKQNRLYPEGSNLSYVQFLGDFPMKKLTNLWMDTAGAADKTYVVQTATKVIARCMLSCTDPGDLILDPTCGSGTTAFVSEKWGRRWITCDTSRVSIVLTRQRLITSNYDYYQLLFPDEGISEGFSYKKIPHITLRSIANDEPLTEEILYDQPLVDKTKARITGPFTVEAVPSPIVKSLEDLGVVDLKIAADNSIARQGQTLRQDEWRDELLKTGIRGKSSQSIEFSRVEPLAGTKWLQADAESKEKEPKRIVVSFGPEHAPLEARQVALAIEEAQSLVPKPKLIVFAAFQFDPEAAKDIDELNWPGVTILKAQMNPDLLTEDLKKKRTENQSFWLIGQPDVELRKNGEKFVVEIKGFDYYNTITGQIESGATNKIALWLLDPDYDGRSIYPRQVFFPLADKTEGWNKLAKTLKAYIDEDLIGQYSGTISLPFTPGNKIAVKIVDDRGIESLRILKVR